MTDPLAFGRNDPCWCGGGRRYKACHGRDTRSQPGEPVPPDTDDSIFLSPTTSIAKDALKVGHAGAPIYMPTPGAKYHPRPDDISELAATLASASVSGGVRTLDEIGVARFATLTNHGLDDVRILDAQLTKLSDSAIEDIGREVLVQLRSTLDSLERAANLDEPASTIWIPSGPPERAIGRSLLWAEHYLVPDPLAQLVLNGPLDRGKISRAVSDLLRLRPLIERGLVVPVAEDVARAATLDSVELELSRDLDNADLTAWVDRQLVIEGPTAREVLFVGARDDEDFGRAAHFEMFARIASTDPNTGQFTTRMLNPYDPTFDYGPWIAQTREKTAAKLIREVDEHLAIADALGAHLVTAAPFRARLLRMKQKLTASVPSVTGLLDVPTLASADAGTLARIASNEEAVDAMRRAIRRALRDIEDADIAAGARQLQHLVDDLTAEAENELRRAMRRSAVWTAAVPGGITLSSLLVGASPLIATAVSAASAIAPYVASRADHRSRPAWIFHAARQTRQR